MPNVTFYRGNSEYIKNLPIRDGQLIYNIETGETYEDVLDTRVKTSSTNIIDDSATNSTSTWSSQKISQILLECAKAKILWKNASPRSEFPPQTLDVPELAQYTHYAILASLDNYENIGTLTIAPIGKISTISTTRAKESGGCYIVSRQCQNKSDVKKLTFENCFRYITNADGSSSHDTNNKSEIPLEVWGLNVNE